MATKNFKGFQLVTKAQFEALGTKKDTRKKQDMSKNVPQNPKLKEKLEIKTRTDLTEKQRELIKVLTDKNTKT